VENTTSKNNVVSLRMMEWSGRKVKHYYCVHGAVMGNKTGFRRVSRIQLYHMR